MSVTNLKLLVATIVFTLVFISDSPNSVAQFGQPPSVVQLPSFGITIDADGVVKQKTFAEAGGRLFFERAMAARETWRSTPL